MSQTPSVDAYLRKLDELYREFTAQLEAAIEAYGSTKDAEALEACLTRLRRSAGLLGDHLSDEDRPEWLSQIQSAAQQYVGDPRTPNAIALLRRIIRYYGRIQEIHFEEGISRLDFDEIYYRYREEGRLGELFDELIRIINQIIESGEIDLITALGTLKQIVSLLRANRDGSLVAVKSTILSARFLFNLVDVIIRDIPVLKQFREAFERTVEQGIQEVEQIESNIRNEAVAEILKRMPKLKELPNFQSEATVFMTAPALPAPDPSSSDSGE